MTESKHAEAVRAFVKAAPDGLGVSMDIPESEEAGMLRIGRRGEERDSRTGCGIRTVTIDGIKIPHVDLSVSHATVELTIEMREGHGS